MRHPNAKERNRAMRLFETRNNIEPGDYYYRTRDGIYEDVTVRHYFHNFLDGYMLGLEDAENQRNDPQERRDLRDVLP